MATIAASRGSGLPVPQDTSASHPYTCNSCQVAFRNSELQRGHMRSDWHRYNLKRRVASLPPISSETFTEKVLQARAATSAQADKAGYARSCDACQKDFFSENAYQNHIGSHKHKAREIAMSGRAASVADETSSVVTSSFSLGEPASKDQEVDSDAEDEFSRVVKGIKETDLSGRPSPVKRPSNPQLAAAQALESSEQPTGTETSSQDQPSVTPVPAKGPSINPTLNMCLFCNYDSASTDLNATHMERVHGMFVPEKSYLVDLDGLIRALQQRVYDYCECLYCGKVKSNFFAAQTHMRDKSHCKIPYTTEYEQLEIGEFYDFRSTYSDDEGDEDDEVEDDADKSKGSTKLGAPRSSKLEGEDGDEVMEDGDGWETDSSSSSMDSQDDTAVEGDSDRNQSERSSKLPHAHKPNRAFFHDEYELYLPSGKSVGHRSLNRYYRQNLHSYPTAEERAEQQLALENGDQSDTTETGRETRGRALVSRDPHARGQVARRHEGGVGMLGVSEEKKKEIKRAEKRSRRQEHAAMRRAQWRVNKEANNQKYHNYEEL